MGINQSNAYGRMKEDSYSDAISEATEASISSFQEHIKIDKKELMRASCCYKKNGHVNCRIPITNFAIEKKMFKIIGGGIFEVIDRSTNLRFVMKCFDKTEVSNSGQLTVLQGHKNIVDCKHVFKTKNYHFIIEELLRCSLFDCIKDKQTVGDLSFARVLGLELAEVLRFIHSKGLVYADLQLENVMFNRNGLLKLADFDMALNTRKSSNEDFEVFRQNSVKSMAPEQIRDRYKRHTDWFNYGMILCTTIEGKSPNEEFFVKDDEGKIDLEKTRKCICENKKDFVLQSNGANEAAAELIDKCLKNKENKRIDLDNDKVFNEVSFLQNITEEERENFRKRILEFAKRREASLYLY